jgi:hypothetical protein
MKELHRADVVDVNFFFEHDDHPFPVQLDRQDRRREEEFADGRFSLHAATKQAKRAHQNSSLNYLSLGRKRADEPWYSRYEADGEIPWAGRLRLRGRRGKYRTASRRSRLLLRLYIHPITNIAASISMVFIRTEPLHRKNQREGNERAKRKGKGKGSAGLTL